MGATASQHMMKKIEAMDPPGRRPVEQDCSDMAFSLQFLRRNCPVCDETWHRPQSGAFGTSRGINERDWADAHPIERRQSRALTELGHNRHHFGPHRRLCEDPAPKPPGLTTVSGRSRRYRPQNMRLCEEAERNGRHARWRCSQVVGQVSSGLQDSRLSPMEALPPSLPGPRAHLSTTLHRGPTNRTGQRPLQIAKIGSKRDLWE